ncbi:PspC domain-containing protein [Gordonia humi]|uniref:Phage shock protein PspC (Stress-responsive transcriptional regulator) n=1 Tax=Gordonia humi TaxID=686429 RepID=A0A840EVR1_9ACTN|nr:PspC domain-containing protein [Gordonia humi]MBB4135631.1 phage shock protein PspC (stress-responsive transcriptional regulator) [Gordonia humi]
MNASTIQDMWTTRPVRRREGNTIGGVCAGIGDRYRVDPTLVKVAFVVATVFGGSGVLLYIAALIAFPADDETEPRREHRRRRHNWNRNDHPLSKVVPLAILAVIVFSVIGSQFRWGSSGFLGFLLMGVGWWLLYQRTPQAPAGTSADQLVQAPAPVMAGMVEAPGGVDLTKPTLPAGTPADGLPTAPIDQPPSWDPLGAAKFAWDLPEPTVPAEPPAPRVPRSPVTPIFLGLAVMTGAAGAAANLAGVDWFTPGRIASLVLAVLGLGLVMGALTRKRGGSGLVPVTLVAAVVVVATTGFAGMSGPFPNGGVGDRTWHPRAATDLRDSYELTLGSTTLDLRDLGPLDRDRTIRLRQGVGDMTVYLPDDIRVRTDCEVTVGDVTCTDGLINPDAKTPTLTIDAHVTVGGVEMTK